MAPGARVDVAEASVLVAGLARDCAGAAEATLRALAGATAGFRRVRVLLAESDSADDTPARLAALADGERLRLLSLGRLAERMPLRTERLAHCRNVLREEAAGARYRDADYVVLADLDGVNRRLRRAALESPWASDAPWDVATANQPGRYYDVWALRHPVWSPDDCWQAAARLEPVFGRRAARRFAVRARQMRLPPGAAPVEVESAFGGLAVYRRAAFLEGRYRGLDAEGREICEHVPFHADLRAAGRRIFIVPAMLNATQGEHLGGLPGALVRLRRALG